MLSVCDPSSLLFSGPGAVYRHGEEEPGSFRPAHRRRPVAGSGRGENPPPTSFKIFCRDSCFAVGGGHNKGIGDIRERIRLIKASDYDLFLLALAAAVVV